MLKFTVKPILKRLKNEKYRKVFEGYEKKYFILLVASKFKMAATAKRSLGGQKYYAW